MGPRASLALRQRLRRLLAALLLAAFAASGLLDVHHRASVVHFTCPADGALAHGDHGHAGAGAEERGAPRATAGPELAALPAPGGGHAEHCGLPDLGQASELDLAGPTAPLPPRGAAPEPRLAPGARAHASVPRLSLAPKQSPPRAA